MRTCTSVWILCYTKLHDILEKKTGSFLQLNEHMNTSRNKLVPQRFFFDKMIWSPQDLPLGRITQFDFAASTYKDWSVVLWSRTILWTKFLRFLSEINMFIVQEIISVFKMFSHFCWCFYAFDQAVHPGFIIEIHCPLTLWSRSSSFILMLCNHG